MKVQNKTSFKLISICSKHTSAMIINILKGLINKKMQHSRLNGLKAGEKYLYSKECRGVYLFSLLLLMCESYSERSVDQMQEKNCIFRKSAAALVFVRLILRAAFCRGYTVLTVFAGFITLRSICITFECIIGFVVNFYYICGLYYICGQLLHLWLQRGLLSYLLAYLTTDPPTLLSIYPPP